MPFDLRRAQPVRPGLVESIAAANGAIFFILGLLVTFNSSALDSFDKSIGRRAFDFSDGRDHFVSFLNGMANATGSLEVLIALALAAAYAWWRKERRIAVWIILSAVLQWLLNPLLKQAFVRHRPTWDHPLNSIGGYSFPSGHADGAGVFCTVAILMTILLTGRGLRRRLLITLWVVLGLAIAANRVLLGVHYFSDVVAGLTFGILIALVGWILVIGDSVRHPHILATITGTGRKKVGVIFNPIKVGDMEVFKDRVRIVAARDGWSEPVFWETTIEDPGAGQAQQALESGVDLIIAAGGDGTVRVVCDEVARTGVAVGILPHGTGNLLARNIGIPLNIKDALDVVFSGQDRAIDLATFSTDTGEDTVFLVMAGLGMDAAIMTGVDDTLKAKVGWVAYFVSGIKALRFAPVRVSISVDDGEFVKFRARTIVVGNVGFLQGGIPLLPDAQIDDGLLDVIVLAPKRFLGWLAIVVRVIGRQKRTNERLGRMTGKKVVIRAERPTPMQLDGDPVGEGTEITIEVQPGVLLIRVPLGPAPVS